MKPSPPPVSRARKITGWVLAAMVASLCVFIGPGILVPTLLALHTGEPYHIALSAAQNSPEVQAALGTHIQSGWIVTGKDSYDPEKHARVASITVPIHGNTTSGIVHFEGIQPIDGPWQINVLLVILDDGSKSFSLKPQP